MLPSMSVLPCVAVATAPAIVCAARNALGGILHPESTHALPSELEVHCSKVHWWWHSSPAKRVVLHALQAAGGRDAQTPKFHGNASDLSCEHARLEHHAPGQCIEGWPRGRSLLGSCQSCNPMMLLRSVQQPQLSPTQRRCIPQYMLFSERAKTDDHYDGVRAFSNK